MPWYLTCNWKGRPMSNFVSHRNTRQIHTTNSSCSTPLPQVLGNVLRHGFLQEKGRLRGNNLDQSSRQRSHATKTSLATSKGERNKSKLCHRERGKNLIPIDLGRREAGD